MPALHEIFSGTSAEDIKDIIEGAVDGDTVRFYNGTYSIDRILSVSTNNITIEAASGASVTLQNDGTTPGPTLKVESTSPLPLPDYTLHEAATADVSSIKIAYDASAPLVVDDTLYLYEPNDGTYLYDMEWIDPGSGAGYATANNANGETNNYPTNERHLREFHTVIDAITPVDEDGGGYDYWQVTLAEATPYAFSSIASVVRASELVTGVEISNMTFTYDSPTLLAEDNYYSEAATGWKGKPTLDLNGTLNATVENVTITLPESHGLRVNRSYGATLTDVTVEGAQSRTGGNGCHFVLQEAFNTTAAGLESLDYINGGTNYGGVRHSLLFSAYHAEHYNQIHFAKATRDINFHGSVDTGNYVVIDEFDYSSMPGTIETPDDPEFTNIWNIIHRDVADQHPHQLDPDADGNSIADIFETLNKVWVTGTFVGGPYADLVMAMPSAEETDL